MCVWVNVPRSPIPDERHVPNAAEQVKVTVRCAPLLLKERYRDIHTESSDQPTDEATDRPIHKKNMCNVKYDMPAQKRYFAHKIFILCFRIYQFDVYAVVSSKNILFRTRSQHDLSCRLVSFLFDSRFRIFASSILIIFYWRLLFQCIRCARAPCPHIQRSSDPNRYGVDKQMCIVYVLPPILPDTDTPSSINYL